ncbi:hypothetical protein FFLO_05303 [Filobasidium floriforme]|uniref:Sodium/calcium exchanger membrane region domain-containing protein n=1 Tax=Filobasidium floriforme TaxID=5210 RepID=A0A8K0NNC3_9TREE|nr:hypothetical protein FFLO_05303 [Filobasidium floriforme]
MPGSTCQKTTDSRLRSVSAVVVPQEMATTRTMAELLVPDRKLGSDPTWSESLKNTVKSSYIVYLLPLVPVAWALHFSHQSDVIVFVFSFLAVIPLASLLSFATEQLALRTGDALGGLLNATFGNAVELLISILALVKGEIGLVQASMIGSILSNTLLVLGCCFLAGGLRFHEQIYSTSATQLQISLLGIAMCALVLPAAFQFSLSSLSTTVATRPIEEITDLDSSQRATLLSISRGVSFMLLSTYAVYLVFQLYTHAYLFKRRPQANKRPHHEPGEPHPNHEKVIPINEWVAAVRSRGSASSSSDGLTPTTTRDTTLMHTNTIDGTTGNSTAIDVELGGIAPPSIRDNRSMLEFGTDDDEEEEEKPLVKAIFALVLLLAVTGITGVTAEFLVSSINGVTESTSMSPEFVGMILLPIVGNVPEHVCAVTVSIKDKLDLSLSIAVGSTIQVALGILPLLVLIGWAMGQPMSLFFDAFQIISLAVSLIIVQFAISDGRSCFAEGYILIMTYCIFALCSWYYDPSKII